MVIIKLLSTNVILKLLLLFVWVGYKTIVLLYDIIIILLFMQIVLFDEISYGKCQTIITTTYVHAKSLS